MQHDLAQWGMLPSHVGAVLPRCAGSGAEQAAVFGVESEVVQALVVGRVAALPIDVVQTVVEKGTARCPAGSARRGTPRDGCRGGSGSTRSARR